MKIRLLFACGLVAGAAACGASQTPLETAAPTGKTVDAATAGTITGRVIFEGTPPAREPLKMGTDKVCAAAGGPAPLSEAVLIAKDGALKNAFIYIKEGLDPAYSFPVPAEAAKVDQKGCEYSPRVLGVRAGQPIEIANSDPTLHNVHSLPKTNQEFNLPYPAAGITKTRTFTAPEQMVRLKCDVHAWMTAYVGVMAHPFFAVSGDDGTFEIKGVPPGTYTVEAWHEKFGTRTAKITIAANQTQQVPFSFAQK